MHTLLFALWFFLPAGIANVAPIIAAKLPGIRGLNAPLDRGRIWRGKRIFGSHKTWRGIVAGIIAACVTVYVQQLIYQSYDLVFLGDHSLSYLDYSPFLLGVLFGFGALGGDALKSLVKRQMNVADGDAWFPFDQLDYIIGACLLTSLITVRTISEYVAIVLVWFVMHLVFSYIGYLLRLKAKPI